MHTIINFKAFQTKSVLTNQKDELQTRQGIKDESEALYIKKSNFKISH